MGETKASDMASMDEFGDQEKWVNDSSLDHKGHVPLRASTGAWKASFFIIGMGYIFFFSS